MPRAHHHGIGIVEQLYSIQKFSIAGRQTQDLKEISQNGCSAFMSD
jgi:hypothetical protein